MSILTKSFTMPIVCLIFLTSLSTTQTVSVATSNDKLPNLIHINPNFDGYHEYINHEHHIFNKHDSHTKDGSGSVQLLGHHWKKALTSPAFKCEKDKKYLFSAYVKVSKFPKGQNVTFGIIPRSVVQASEMYWNNSRENEWEEVLVPFIATKTGECRFRVFTYTYAYSANNIPEAIDENGTNLNKEVKVLIDDIKVIQSPEVLPREHPSTKVSFNSSFIKIDSLGNFFIKEEHGKWKHIFPKMIYRGKREQYIKYSEYGFNGIMDIWSKDEIEYGLKQGLKYFAISTQFDDGFKGTLQKRIKETIDYTYAIKKPYTFLMYTYINDNLHIQDIKFHEDLAKFIDLNDTDTSTGRRARPIYYLNNQSGLSRSYKNNKINHMDITGTHIGASYIGDKTQEIPKETLGIFNKTHNQIAPAPIIHLQSYLDNTFIPSLFYGIIQGGKAVSVWRDGGAEGNFQNKVWAKSIKNVFEKIDKMLPIIKEPHSTKWSATINNNPHINIGVRDHNNNSYLILSNHAQTDKIVTISLQGIKAKGVQDYFTNEKLAIIKNNQFQLTIGHGNDGYKVLRLVK